MMSPLALDLGDDQEMILTSTLANRAGQARSAEEYSNAARSAGSNWYALVSFDCDSSHNTVRACITERRKYGVMLS